MAAERLERGEDRLSAEDPGTSDGAVALLLRKLLGKVRLEPTQGDIGRPYYRAVCKLQVLVLTTICPVTMGRRTPRWELEGWFYFDSVVDPAAKE